MLILNSEFRIHNYDYRCFLRALEQATRLIHNSKFRIHNYDYRCFLRALEQATRQLVNSLTCLLEINRCHLCIICYG